MCSFETVQGETRRGARGFENQPPCDLSIVNSRIKKAKCDREDDIKDPIESVPSDDQPNHRVAGLVNPIQIPVRRVFGHEQHDPGVTVERRDRKEVERPEE
jgi:hypothetical protein